MESFHLFYKLLISLKKYVSELHWLNIDIIYFKKFKNQFFT